MTLLEKVKNYIIANTLVHEGDKVMLAVSGGLDSVAMLHLFVQLKTQLKLKLSVIHVHHGIRGTDADEDYEFVQSLSKSHGLPFFSQMVNTKQYAEEHKTSLEESARILRYCVFDECLQKSGFKKLAIAHTANDQGETIIDHFLRGSGSLGLQGMPVKRGSYIRPLLFITREELKLFVHEQKLVFREDSTNTSNNFKRNRIRNELLPYLQDNFNPNLIHTLNRTSKIFSESEAFLQAYADKAFKSLVSLHKKNEITLEIKPFLNYFNVVQKYILIKACLALGISRIDLNFDKLDHIVSVIKNKKVGKRAPINKAFEVLVDHDGIVIRKKIRDSLKCVSFNPQNTSVLRFGKYEFFLRIMENVGKLPDSSCFNEFLDFEKTGSELTMRTLKPGDRFVPLNLRGHKKIADYFSDKKVPIRQRKLTPILESPSGIVWVCGYCIDDRFKVRKQTRQLLNLEIKNIPNAN